MITCFCDSRTEAIIQHACLVMINVAIERFESTGKVQLADFQLRLPRNRLSICLPMYNL